MHRANMHAFAAASLMMLCTALPGFALAQDREGERNWNLGIALGQGQRENPLLSGDDIDIHYVIDFSWYGERFFFDNGDLGYLLLAESNYSLSAIATYNNERNYYNYLDGQEFGLRNLISTGLGGNKGGLGTSLAPEGNGTDSGKNNTVEVAPGYSVDSTYLNENTELADRKFAVNGGLEFLYISPYGDVQAQVLTDISSTHDGQEAWLSWSKPWFTRNSEVSLTLGVEWKSQNLVGYYYGVRPEEAFPGRDIYEGGSGSNSFVRLAGRYSLTDHWTLVGMVEREFLSSAIKASPIVTSSAVDTFFTGLFYQF
jgi:outer membrane protein